MGIAPHRFAMLKYLSLSEETRTTSSFSDIYFACIIDQTNIGIPFINLRFLFGMPLLPDRAGIMNMFFTYNMIHNKTEWDYNSRTWDSVLPAIK